MADDDKAKQEEYMRKRMHERLRTRPELRPEHGAGVRAARRVLSKGHMILPVVACFAIGAGAWVTYESMQRRGKPVCVNCDRQRQIAEEVYGMKPSKPQATRQMP